MFILLFITSQPATCEDSETFHIVLSTSSPCPGELTGEPCITLSQYLRGEYRRYYTSDPSEMVLEFQPGFHAISTGYSTLASQLSSFVMNSESEKSTQIYCQSDYTQYQITNVQSVQISGIDFVRCTLQIESVMNFTLEESSLSRSQILGLRIRSSSAIIIGCNFTNNHNRYPSSLHIDNSSLELHHTNFVDNEGSGGVLLIENTISMVTISHCTFIDNSAFATNGGVASIRNATVSILNSTFSQNRAVNGGVFAIDDTEMTVHGSIFDNNDARASSGVFAVDDSEITIHDSTFDNNTAGTNGGVFVVDDTEMTIYGSTFNNNTAGTSGGVFAVDDTEMTIYGSTFDNNTAGTNGGVISIN